MADVASNIDPTVSTSLHQPQIKGPARPFWRPAIAEWRAELVAVQSLRLLGLYPKTPYASAIRARLYGSLDRSWCDQTSCLGGVPCCLVTATAVFSAGAARFGRRSRLGETQPGGKHSYAGYLPPEWRECTIAYLLGTFYLAMRAEDVLQCARFQADYPADDVPPAVHLVSVGRVGPPALHAAFLEPAVFASIELRGSLVSWSDVVRTPLSRNQHVNLVHGALRMYDLPDLVAALGANMARIIDPVDATEQHCETAGGDD